LQQVNQMKSNLYPRFVAIGCLLVLQTACTKSIPVSSREYDSGVIRELSLGKITNANENPQFLLDRDNNKKNGNQIAAQKLSLILDDISKSNTFLKHRSPIGELLVDGHSRFWIRLKNCEYFVIEQLLPAGIQRQGDEIVSTNQGNFVVTESGVMTSCKR
jgi:hypothetical protein